MWAVCTVEYYAAVKSDNDGAFVMAWMDLDGILVAAIIQKGKDRRQPVSPIDGVWEQQTKDQENP